MSTLYVDNLQPNLGSRVSIPGHVVQVIQETISPGTNNSTTSFFDIGLSAVITPTSASSKVLVFVDVATTVYKAGVGYFRSEFNIVRNSTEIRKSMHGLYLADGSDNNCYSNYNTLYLDSPSTTSATTYKVQGRNTESGSNLVIEGGGRISSITLMEIAQ
jgi:hypothetical protein